MAVSQIEEKILGRLARLAEPSNPLLSASLYQVLGLSILLSRKLFRARKVRRLDITRDTKSLKLYHHIIWLAREGLSIVDAYILPFCQNGESGSECRVMAAKLRASFYHIFCTFHNHPPVVNSSKSGSSGSDNSPNSDRSAAKSSTQHRHRSSKSSTGGDNADKPSHHRQRKSHKSGNAFRDPVLSMSSETSYITNPYASPTPPPVGALPAVPSPRKTPTRPPGLPTPKLSSPQAAASFLLPPLNFIPMTRSYFDTAQKLATTLLPGASALRLSICLEHAVFLWDIDKSAPAARNLARTAIKTVYASPEGLDDDEFADASALVQALGGIVRRGSANPTPPQQPRPSPSPANPKSQIPRPTPRPGPIDRTIALSPPQSHAPTKRSRGTPSPLPLRSTPDRLSTVPEDPSQEPSERGTNTAPTTLSSPPMSRLSSRSKSEKLRRASSSSAAGSVKAAKRRVLEAAELEVARRSAGASRKGSRSEEGGGSESRKGSQSEKGGGGGSGVGSRKGSESERGVGGSESRQATPSEGYVRVPASATVAGKRSAGDVPPPGTAAPAVQVPVPAVKTRLQLPPQAPPSPPLSASPTKLSRVALDAAASTVRAERDRRIAVAKALEILALSKGRRQTPP